MTNQKNKLYFGIPSGSLYDNVINYLSKAGWPIEKTRQYEIISPFDDEIIFRILDRKELAQQVAKGIVDAGITGRDYIYETRQENNVITKGNFIFSKKTAKQSRLVLASRPEKNITSPQGCKNKVIATEFPELTKRMMRKLYGISDFTILPSNGKTELKVYSEEADAFTDIVETGETLIANGNIIIGELFRSNPQLIINKDSIKNDFKAEKIEDIRIGIRAVIEATKQPMYMVYMNVPKKALIDINNLLPSVTSPTITQLEDDNWVSLSVVMKEKELGILAPKLLRVGAEGIIPINIPKVYTQQHLEVSAFVNI